MKEDKNIDLESILLSFTFRVGFYTVFSLGKILIS